MSMVTGRGSTCTCRNHWSTRVTSLKSVAPATLIKVVHVPSFSFIRRLPPRLQHVSTASTIFPRRICPTTYGARGGKQRCTWTMPGWTLTKCCSKTEASVKYLCPSPPHKATTPSSSSSMALSSRRNLHLPSTDSSGLMDLTWTANGAAASQTLTGAWCILTYHWSTAAILSHTEVSELSGAMSRGFVLPRRSNRAAAFGTQGALRRVALHPRSAN
mmetsp:Transcript_4252/g.12033  ORF Transcript_4252/g.12033 Transcript_4252/m.12033 type:complete len:216 (-) Transcript_4252:93-740(-)